MASADDLLYSDDPQADVAGQGWAALGDYIKQKSDEKLAKDRQFSADVHNKNWRGAMDYANDNAMNVAMGSLGGEGPKSGPGGNINAFRSAANEAPSILKEGIPAGRLSESAPALDMSEPARMARARSMGFDISSPVYHGTKANIESFDPAALGASTNAGSARQGYFFAEDPSTASDYARLSNDRDLLAVQRGVDIPDKQAFQAMNNNPKGLLFDAENKLDSLIRNDWESNLKYQDMLQKNIQSVEDKLSGKKVEKFPAPREYLEQKLVEYKGKLANLEPRLTDAGEADYQKELAEAFKDYTHIKGRVEAGPNLETNVIPAYLKTENPYIHDFKGADYRDTPYAAIMKKAKEAGHDSVIFKNTYDPGDPNNRVLQDITAVFDPSQIRSKFAAFDPRKSGSGNISAGVAGAGLLGGAALAGNQAEAGEPMSIDDLPPPPGAKSSIDDLPPPPSLGGTIKNAGLSMMDASPMGFLAKRAGQAVIQDPKTLQAAGEHALDTGTLGYGPQIESAVQSGSVSSPEYVKNRDLNRARMEEENKNYPISSNIGKGVGFGLGTLATGGILPEIEGASLGARALQAAGTGGLLGAAANPGDTQGQLQPVQGMERLQHGALGAAMGAVAQPAAEKAEQIKQFLAAKFGDSANALAFRALGPFKRQAAQNLNRADEIGAAALEHGVVGGLPTNAAGLAERAQEAKGMAGKKLQGITDQLAGQEAGATTSGIPREQIAKNLEDKLIVDSSVPAVQERNNRFQSWIDEFKGTGDENLSFKDLRKMKMDVGGTETHPGLIKWNRLPHADIPPEEQFHRALYTELKNGEEQGAQALDQAFNGNNASSFKDAKTDYQNLKTARDIAQNRAASQAANRAIGLTDTIAGAGGAAVGGYLGDKAGGYEGAKVGALLGGGIGAVGNKLGRTYGSQVGASTANNISKFFQGSPDIQKLLEQNPGIAGSLTGLMTRDDKNSSEKPFDKSLVSPEEARQKFKEGN